MDDRREPAIATLAASPTTDFASACSACKSILIRLQMIHDAPVFQIRVGGRSKSADTRIPAGVNLDNPSSDQSDKRFSLYAHYKPRMDTAVAQRDTDRLVKLAECATRDWKIYTGTLRVAQFENHESAVIELLRDYTGVEAIKVSWALNVSPVWVRRQRIFNGRNPDDGRPREVKGKAAEVIALAKRGGLTQSAIAERVGVTQGQVSRILSGQRCV